MLRIDRFFENLFDSNKISDSALHNFGTVHVQCMEASNPDGHLTPLIETTKGILAAFLDGGSEDLTKLGALKARTMTKYEFRAALPQALGRIHGMVTATFGTKGPEVAECFPEGRRIFLQCRNAVRKEKLQALVTALASHTPPLPPAAAASATELLETWTALCEVQGVAKGEKKAVRATCKEMRSALEVELFRNVLTIALLHLGDGSKAPLYFPQELLRPRAARHSPEATTETGEGGS